MTTIKQSTAILCGHFMGYTIYPLTHWGWEKMAAIFQMIFSSALSWMKMYKVWLRFHQCLLPVNNIPALVQILARSPPGDKPLSEPMMAKVTDAYMHHSASMGQFILAEKQCPLYCEELHGTIPSKMKLSCQVWQKWKVNTTTFSGQKVKWKAKLC